VAKSTVRVIQLAMRTTAFSIYPLCQLSFESLYARLCSSTAATSRKQVTNRLYFVMFNLILKTQISSHLNESCYTSNLYEQP